MPLLHLPHDENEAQKNKPPSISKSRLFSFFLRKTTLIGYFWLFRKYRLIVQN